MDEFSYRVHASGLANWNTCPAREVDKIINADRWYGESVVVPVAQRFGVLVHNRITGQPDEDAPFSIEYDSTTENERQLLYQVDLTAKAIIEALKDWEIIGSEIRKQATIRYSDWKMVLTGKVDLIVRHKETGIYAVIDLKTGQWDTIGSWMQVAAYCWMLEQNYEHEIEQAILIHAPRGENYHGQPVVNITTKPAKEISRIIPQYLNRLNAGFKSNQPIPGKHCHKCENVDCIFLKGETQ